MEEANAIDLSPGKKRCRFDGSMNGDSKFIAEDGTGLLPSKDVVASKGLEAKVDMATYGRQSWALTDLGGWRAQHLVTQQSPEFVAQRQRDARRAMLRGEHTSGSIGAPTI
ncbi:unnamed protein product [Choristocarpus tenellus]